MNTLEILVEAKELISDPARWIQGNYAKDELGVDVDPRSKSAVCWCSLGALYKISNNVDFTEYASANRALSVVARDANPVGVSAFNDSRTHAEVMMMWDDAIAIVKEHGEK